MNEVQDWKEFKVGDLIAAYHEGYHKLIKITRRVYMSAFQIPTHLKSTAKIGDEHSPIFEYVKVYNVDGTKCRSKVTNICDAAFCKLATDSIESKLKQMEVDKLNLTEILRIYGKG